MHYLDWIQKTWILVNADEFILADFVPRSQNMIGLCEAGDKTEPAL